MKKILLMGAMGLAAFSADAQLALQNFNASTLPTGWSMIKVDNNTPSTGLVPWIQSQMATNAWMLRTRATGDSCMLTTSMFTPAGTADRWLVTPSFTVNNANCVITWEDAQGIQGATDMIEVWVSTSGGTTVSSFSQMIAEHTATPFVTAVTYVKHGASLAAYNGQNVRVAFRNHSTNGGTIRLDNVQTEVPTILADAAVWTVNFPKICLPASSNQVSVEIKNNGAQNITSLNMTYKIDGGSPQTQNFTGLLIPPYGTGTINFTATVNNLGPGSHTLDVLLNQLNGAADPVTGNNQNSMPFIVATQTVPRNGLIEEFSSSTCPPCASFNATFDTLLVGTSVKANVAASRFNVIKYQMNWPSPNNDRSYNAHGASRQTYYGVSGIPDHYTNGMPGGAGNLAEINASKTAPAFMGIWGNYVIKNGTMDVSYTVTPYVTTTGSYKVYAAAVQREFDLLSGDPSHTTSQSHFVFAMRRMFPDGNGESVSSWTSGTGFSKSYTAQAFTVGSVTQGGFQWWSNPIASDLVVFVQDATTDEILQSQVIAATWPTDAANIANDTKVIVYPNPASDYAVVALNMDQAATINIRVTDALGRTVYTTAEKLESGRHDVVINTMSLASGLYNVTIQTEKGSITERLSVVK